MKVPTTDRRLASFRIRISVLLGLLLLCPVALAQTTTASLSGTISDQNAAAIQGVVVTAHNLQTDARRISNTDRSGHFQLFELSPGEYEVTAEQAGFSKEIRRGILLTVGRAAVVNLTLQVGVVSDQVVVTGDAPAVNTTGAEISHLVSARAIQSLPLNGRDLFQLATLETGVINVGDQSNLQIKAGPGAVKIAINGARVNFNNFLLDGTSINDFANTTPGSFAGGFSGVEDIQEFQVLTNNYGAEFGGAGGGIINMITRSGTNQVHGSAFEFIRNSALDARNFFDLADVPPFKRNQFGGSISGPIVKDKTFFFADYEGLRERLADTIRFTVPTREAREGVLPAGDITVSPAIKPYLSLYPLPNGPDIGGGMGFFIRAATAVTDDNRFTTRVDHHPTDRDTIFARYLFDQSNNNSPDHVIQDTVNRGRNQYVALGLTHTFSGRFLGEFRFGFNRSNAFGDIVDRVPIPSSLLWVPGATHIGDFGLSFGLSPLSDNVFYPRPITMNNFEPSAQFEYSAGAHSIEFGTSARRIQLNALSSNAADGAYLFSSYASFLEARPFLFFAQTANSDAYRGIRESLFSFYGQDQWKVTRRLTLTYGLRYEFITVPTEAHGKVSNFRDILHDATPTVGGPFFLNPSYRDFAPRLGLAWDITGDGKTALRGGFGIFYAQPFPDSFRFAFSDQPPFFQSGLVVGRVPFPNAFQSLGPDFLGASQIETYQYKPNATYVMQWNLSLQRELGRGMTVTASYVGSRGIHLVTDGNRNTSADFQILPDGEKQFPSGQPALRNSRFPAPIRSYQTDADSFYHALQVVLDRRLARGLEVHVAYTFSKSIDTASDGFGTYVGASTQFAQDPYNLAAEKALSLFDCRHSFSLGAVYDLPSPHMAGGVAARIANASLGGWQVDTILTVHSGTPFTPGIGNLNNSNDGNTIDSAERPDYAPGFSGSVVTGNPNHYINTSAFRLAPAGQYGNVGRNTIEGPGLFTVDIALAKAVFRIRERLKAEFRAEAFNLFNRANFALPANTTVVSQGGVVPANAGVITSTATPSRQLQFALKLVF